MVGHLCVGVQVLSVINAPLCITLISIGTARRAVAKAGQRKFAFSTMARIRTADSVSFIGDKGETIRFRLCSQMMDSL
jgi:endonuclease YncB( thermonuclease family)